MLNFWQICLSDVHSNWGHSLKLAELLALLVYFAPRSLLLLIILLDMSFCPMLQIKLFSPAVNLLVFTTSHFLLELLPTEQMGIAPSKNATDCHYSYSKGQQFFQFIVCFWLICRACHGWF